MAKDLIQKGYELNDPELVSMGMNMLEKYGEPTNTVIVDDMPEPLPVIPERYICTNCDYTSEVDKVGRKKCPLCKKHTLQIMAVAPVEAHIAEPITTSRRPAAGDFSTQVRQTGNSRVRYNDEGRPDGTYARVEQVAGMKNEWQDDGSEGHDSANELLKKFTKFTPRTRKPTRLAKVICNECKTEHEVHPIHAGGRGRYICDKCVKRRSRV